MTDSHEEIGTRDGSLREGSSNATRDKEARLRDETNESCAEDLTCREESDSHGYDKDFGDEDSNGSSIDSPAIPSTENEASKEDLGDPPRAFMTNDKGEEMEFQEGEGSGTENKEPLVPVPAPTDATDIERLADLTKGLSPKELEKLTQETILMPEPIDMDQHLGWNLEQIAEVLQVSTNQGTSG